MTADERGHAPMDLKRRAGECGVPTDVKRRTTALDRGGVPTDRTGGGTGP